MFFNLENYSTLLVCYFLGSIPFGLIISKVLNKHDPRLVGSKNIGATNILRTSGWKLGLLTLFCDVFKGYLPLIFFDNSNLSIELMILFIFLGHLFPVWLRFKGGKGIAVIIGCLLAYNPLYGLAFATVWVSIAFISKYSSFSINCFFNYFSYYAFSKRFIKLDYDNNSCNDFLKTLFQY